MEKKKDQYNIAVLGAGSWGITLANVLYENGHNIKIWEFDPLQASKLRKKRKFLSLEAYCIPKEIDITSSLKNAVTAVDFIVVSVPSAAIKSVAQELSKISIMRSTIVISTVKGFDKATLKRPSEILKEHLRYGMQIAVLSGPSHAEEVIKKIPTAIVTASRNRNSTRKIQTIFSNVYFRVYNSSDIKGVELGGALKNVIAVASGIASGLKLGDNTRAALITRGNAEITRLGIALGARKVTFNGLSGIGDLIVTCFSEHSRNFRFGKYLGEGYSIDEANEKAQTTVEGINTTQSCYKLSKKYNVQMPVCSMVYKILFKDKSPSEAWRELMLRPLKSENINAK